MKTELIKTTQVGDKVVHYSCNSPSEELCDKLKIEMLGEMIDRDPRELLAIPVELFKWKPINEITAENLLRDLTK